MAPALLWGPGAIDSGVLNYTWTKQWSLALGRGELYPRWLPHSFEGLGSPTFFFYPPLAFLLSGLLDLAGLGAHRAVAGAALCVLLASGATMYLWLRAKTPHALLGACLYMAAPYHLNDFYDRAALAEFAAYAWLPVIAIAIEAQPKRWAGPLLAVAYAGLIATHLPVALLTSVLLIGPMVAYAAYRRSSPEILIRCAAAGAVGLGLAMAYLLPALTLQHHVSMRLLAAPSFQPWRWSLLHPSGGVKMPLLIAYSSLAAGGAVLALGAMRRNAAFWPLLALCVAGLSLNIVPILWTAPLLEKVQFPWRSLVIVEFAVVTALCMAPVRRGLLPLAVAVAAPGVVLLTGIAAVGMHTPYPPNHHVVMTDAAEYLPRGALAPEVRKLVGRPPLERFRVPLVQGPARRVATARADELVVEADGPGVVTIRRAAFPIWRVTHDGRVVDHLPGPLLRFPVEAGRYRIARAALREEALGAAISLASLPLLLALLWRRDPRRLRAPAGPAALNICSDDAVVAAAVARRPGACSALREQTQA